MTDTITTFAEKLQELFYDFPSIFSEESAFILRNRLLDIQKWLFTSLNWITQSNPTLGSLAALFDNQRISITKQALSKKFDMSCVKFLRKLLAEVLRTLVNSSNAKAPPLLSLFSKVFIADCTRLQLSQQTKDLFPGVGGNKENVNASELKIFLRIEATTGIIDQFLYDSGRTSDHAFYKRAPPLPKHSLELADMGFLSQERMLYNQKNSIYYICRIQSQSIIYYNNQKYSISEFLLHQKGNEIDVHILLGKRKVPCRLLGRKVSEEVAKQKLANVTRKAQKERRPVSQAQVIVSKWQFYVTNIESNMCTFDEIIILYSVRWQIELIFKLWKKEMNLNKSNGKTTARVLCEKLLKMINILIFHSHEILADIGPVCEVSHVEVLDRYKVHFSSLLEALYKHRSIRTIVKIVRDIVKFIRDTPKRSKSKKERYTHDLLQNKQINQINMEFS